MAMQKHTIGTWGDTKGNDDALIARYIEPHPAKPGIVNYSLRGQDGGYPVWAIIGDLAPGILSEEDIMREFRISRDALNAVLAFYARHKEVIDARIVANRLD
jgi:uncharacterized protein (DUF433 family)